jgi:hypothetical protein
MTALLVSSPTCYVSSLAECTADGRWILARSPGAFLLTDIEGSSLLWQRSPGSMDAAEDCLREATELGISKGDMTSPGLALYHVADLCGRQGRSDICGGILAWLASDRATIQDIRARSKQELEAMGDASGGHARPRAGLPLTEMMTRIW